MGQSISVFGDRMYATALPFLILALGGGAAELSITLTLFAATQAALLPFAGVIVDRLPRRTTLVAADLVRAFTFLLLTALLALDRLTIEVVYAVTALTGAVRAFFRPALRSLIPEILPSERLVAANALRSLSDEVLGAVGPVIAGTLVAIGAMAWVVGAHAASFAVAGLLLLAVPLGHRHESRRPAVQGGIGRVWAELVEGLRATLSIPWLWRMIALSAVANIFFAGALSVALPLLAEASLGGPAGFGALLAAMAVGSVLAVLAIGRAERLWRRGILYYAGFVAAGTGMLLLAFVQDLVLAILVAAFVGAAVAGFVLILETVIQELVPAPILGRVASLESFGSLALLPVGYLLVGVLIGFIGPALTIALLGTATVVAGFIGLGSRSIRSIM